MIPYKAIQQIPLGPIKIQVWGLLVAIGVSIALYLAIKRSKKEHIRKNWVYDVVFYSLLAGIIGSRIGYILFYWPTGEELTILKALDVTKGGLAYTFGLITALIVDGVYMRIKKINFWKFSDFFVPYLVIAHMVGRIGCYMTGMHLGKPTTLPWGIIMDGQLSHPVILYEILVLIGILAILLYIRKRKTFEGAVISSYLILYGLLRFPLDFLRIDVTYFGITAAQYSLILMIIFGAIIFYKRRKTYK